MNTNSTEIKTAKRPSLSCQSNSSTMPTEAVDEIVNEIINPNPGTGDPPVPAGNLPDAPLKVSESQSRTVSGSRPAPQFIKTPEVYSRQGELLTPEHPDYAGILAIITRELSERFQN